MENNSKTTWNHFVNNGFEDLQAALESKVNHSEPKSKPDSQQDDKTFKKDIDLDNQKENLIAAALLLEETTADEHNLKDQIRENKIGWLFKGDTLNFPLYPHIKVLPTKIKIYHRRDRNAEKYHIWSEKPKKEKREFKRRHFYLIINDLDITSLTSYNIKLIPLEIHFIHQPKLKKIEDRNYDNTLWLESKMTYLPDLHSLVQTKVDSDGSDRSDRGSPPPGHRPSRPATRDQRPSSACSCTTQ